MIYQVKQGDCINSIASEFGLNPNTVWQDAGQENIRDEIHRDESVLVPGDRIDLQERRDKTLNLVLNKRHRFRRIGVPTLLRIELKDPDGNPRAGIPYELIVDDTRIAGQTTSAGMVEQFINPQAKTATLRVGDRANLPIDAIHAERAETHLLRLGYLAPQTTLPGVRWRLIQLGYLIEQTQWDSDYDDVKSLRAAIRLFQEENSLEVTGDMNPETEVALLNEHGC
jgi:hypothetical protein